MNPNPRYQGKPFLRLLELYVFWALGKLSDHDRELLVQMTPKLQQTYSKTGEWHEIIAAVMEFPPHMPTLIQDMWARNQEIAARNRVMLEPQQFAEMFVDSNLT